MASVIDVRWIVLESEEFGPEQVNTIRELLANDLQALRQLRETARQLRDLYRSASGAKKRELAKRLGVVEYLLGRATTAQQYLLEVGDDPFALEYLGKAYLAREQFDEAATAFQAARNAGADPVLMTLYEAGAWRRAGNLEKAEELIKSVEKEAKGTAEYHCQLGCLLADKGDRETALKELHNALTADPHHPEALFHAAYLYDLYGEDDLAQELYERCVSRAPVYLGALLNLGILYEDHGQLDRAARCYRRILSIYPTNERARLFLKDAQAEVRVEKEEKRPLETFDRQRALLKKSINEIELGSRARNCLKELGVETLDDLVRLTEADLKKAKNFGETSLEEVKDALARHGLRLGMLPPKTAEVEAEVGEGESEQVAAADSGTLNKSIDEFEVSGRVRRALKNLGINTIRDLTQKTRDDLLSLKNFGKKSLEEVEQALAKLGLSLKA